MGGNNRNRTVRTPWSPVMIDELSVGSEVFAPGPQLLVEGREIPDSHLVRAHHAPEVGGAGEELAGTTVAAEWLLRLP